MHSRKSIPNIGPRAQGRKALFMLRGSGVNSTSISSKGCSLPSSTSFSLSAQDDPGNDPKKRTQDLLKQGSLTIRGEEGGEILPATYDESVLSQPSHPYNRIIQRIMNRHRDRQKMGPPVLPKIKYPDGSYIQGVAAGSAPPHTRNDNHNHYAHSSSYRRKSKSRHPQADTENEPGGSENEADLLQWADILRADHGVTHEDDSDDLLLQHGDLSSSPDNQSPSSLDLAKGYLTDRGLITDRGQDVRDILDTTRSEQQHHHHRRRISSLPRLTRKRGDLDDVLDYFWVYQGMSRQLLDRHTPSHLWTRLQKKPTKLPPLYLAACEPKTEAGSSGAARLIKPSSEDVVADTEEKALQEGKWTSERLCEQTKLRPESVSPVSAHLCVKTKEEQVENDKEMGKGESHGEDGSARGSVSSGEVVGDCDRGQGRRVTLVVKMPVLTHETTTSDMLMDHE